MKHIVKLLLIQAFVPLHVFALGNDSVVWKHPVAIYNSSDVGIERVVQKRDAINVYVTGSCMKSSCKEDSVLIYLDDDRRGKHHLEKIEPVGDSGCSNATERKNVTLLRFRNDGSDVKVFDIVGLHGKEKIHIDGVCDMVAANEMRMSWGVRGKQKGSECMTGSAKKNVGHGYVKGRIQGYDPKLGIGFVCADNEYAVGEPSFYYARINADGSFVFDIPADKPRIFFARMNFLKGAGSVPFWVEPGNTTSFYMEKGADGLYNVSYDNSMCKTRNVSGDFLCCYHDYSVASPYEQGLGFNGVAYEESLYKNRVCERERAIYKGWKYGLTQTEVHLMCLSADISYYTNLLYLQKSDSAVMWMTGDDVKSCVALRDDACAKAIPSYNRFFAALCDAGLATYADGGFCASSEGCGARMESVFDRVEPLRRAIALDERKAKYYQIVFVSSEERCVDQLRSMDNLVHDFSFSKDLQFIFVSCDALNSSRDVKLVVEHFLHGQLCVNLSLDEYYTLNECIGNVADVAISKTLDAGGYVLKQPFMVKNETLFRRMLRKALK